MKVRLLASLAVAATAALTYWLLRPSASSVWFGAIGSVIAAVLFELTLLCFPAIEWLVVRRALARTFGRDAYGDGLYLAYTSFYLSPAFRVVDAQGAQQTHPFVSTDDAQRSWVFSVDEPVAAHDVLGAIYLQQALLRAGAKVNLWPAREIVRSLDRSFVSFGLTGSQKSRQVIEQLCHYGLSLDGSVLMRASDRAPLGTPSAGTHVGYVVRLSPRQFPRRTWMLCGGHGPEGTSGAAFYLSKHFAEISNLKDASGCTIGTGPCVLVTRTGPGVDESTELVSVERLVVANQVASAPSGSGCP